MAGSWTGQLEDAEAVVSAVDEHAWSSWDVDVVAGVVYKQCSLYNLLDVRHCTVRKWQEFRVTWSSS